MSELALWELCSHHILFWREQQGGQERVRKQAGYEVAEGKRNPRMPSNL